MQELFNKYKQKNSNPEYTTCDAFAKQYYGFECDGADYVANGYMRDYFTDGDYKKVKKEKPVKEYSYKDFAKCSRIVDRNGVLVGEYKIAQCYYCGLLGSDNYHKDYISASKADAKKSIGVLR